METIESLSAIQQNQDRYLTKYKFNQDDLDNVNYSIHLIETIRKEDTPIMGDIIECSAPGDGKIKYPAGHLDTPIDCPGGVGARWRGGSICVKPSTSFVCHNGIKLTGFSTSGGYWIRQQDKEMYEPRRKEIKKLFCQFGHNGACHDGAIYFWAKVNEWRLIMETIY